MIQGIIEAFDPESDLCEAEERSRSRQTAEKESSPVVCLRCHGRFPLIFDNQDLRVLAMHPIIMVCDPCRREGG